MNNELKATYNQIAKDWHRDHHSDDWWARGVDHLISLLPPNASVLDIGCGAGHKTKYLLNKGLKVVGADFSEKMLEIARKEIPDVKFRVLDLYEIDSLDEQFDCVFAQAVFLHIPKKDIPSILQKIRCVLTNSGLLYIAVKEVWSNHPDEEVLTENDYGYEYQRFFSYFTVPELQKSLTDANYSIIDSRVIPVGNTDWIQIIARNY